MVAPAARTRPLPPGAKRGASGVLRRPAGHVAAGVTRSPNERASTGVMFQDAGGSLCNPALADLPLLVLVSWHDGP
jgi:hypothetical protein